jgi:hypothetical protein
MPPLACLLLATVGAPPLPAQLSLQITVGPRPIPVYGQPVLPEEGYLWGPAYWAWGEEGYSWVPGTWVQAPEPGLLWTPGDWAWHNDSFEFHGGYWGAHVGYDGGIDHGYGYGGYGGSGFEGGCWQGRNDYDNRFVSNVNATHVSNVNNKTVIVNNTTFAYNGAGGLQAAATLQARTLERKHHVQPTAEQMQQHQVAGRNREFLASVSRGKPPVAANPRPADFSSTSIATARAPGGKLEESTLKATAKPLPQTPRSQASDRKPAHPAPQPPPPASAPAPGPDRRPTPMPTPAPERRPAPAPDRHPAPAPIPVLEHEPEPIPTVPERPAPTPMPAPERRPPPTPAPDPGRHPEPAVPPSPERDPEPAPHPDETSRPKPAPREGPEHQPNPGTPRE